MQAESAVARVRTPSSPVRERERERCRIWLFLKGMAGVLAPFSYLVSYSVSRCHFHLSLIIVRNQLLEWSHNPPVWQVKLVCLSTTYVLPKSITMFEKYLKHQRSFHVSDLPYNLMPRYCSKMMFLGLGQVYY